MSKFPPMPCNNAPLARDVFAGARSNAGKNRRKHTRAKQIIATVAGVVCIASVIFLTACCTNNLPERGHS